MKNNTLMSCINQVKQMTFNKCLLGTYHIPGDPLVGTETISVLMDRETLIK